jgi:hypothetical protein
MTDVSCEAFEAMLPDYFEGALASHVVQKMLEHAGSCDRCESLMVDLDTIRAKARALPVLSPSRDLWEGIDSRIRMAESPSLGRRPVTARQRAVNRWFASPWANRYALAAAALVVVSVGLTFTVTRWWVTRTVPGVAAGVAHLDSGPSGRPDVVPVANSQTVTSEFLYDHEITALHQILQQRRARLDPKTVAVLDRNLAIIDSAIVQSKAALAHDPASAFLANQLDQALNSKLELLKTAALLPART